jgi:hypothetical protein
MKAGNPWRPIGKKGKREMEKSERRHPDASAGLSDPTASMRTPEGVLDVTAILTAPEASDRKTTETTPLDRAA